VSVTANFPGVIAVYPQNKSGQCCLESLA